MPCPRCGQDNPAPARFCNWCGVALAPAVGGAPRPSGGPAAPSSGRGTGGTPADRVAFFRALPPFREFTPTQLELLARSVRERALGKGQELFREGDAGDEMFFVEAGAIVISKGVTGRIEHVLARMGPGDFFGEMSLFGRFPRSATAQAETDTVLLGLDRESLQRIVQLSSPAGLAFFASIIHEFSRRLAATDDLVAEVTRWGLEATGLAVEPEP